jgi:hypothetical protein
VLEEDKLMVITKMVLNFIKQKAARIHRPLKVRIFNENDIRRRRCELSNELQDLHLDVALLSETTSQTP